MPPPRERTLHVLFAENDDSFTWNLVDRLPCARADVELVPGRVLAGDPATLRGADALVVGPGPTDPVRAGLVGLIRAAAALRLPTLGVCLGFQALGLAFGARLVRAEPRHGERSTATFAPSRLLPGIVGPRTVMRYHSLALAGIAPPLRLLAEAEDGVPMAVEHAALPMAGLQFHPDSYATPDGELMLASFFAACGVTP